MSDHNALHLKYRPETLDEVIGHEQAVTKLKGMIASGKFPSTIAFFGPTSAGKTTLARAFASSVLGKLAETSADWFELNGNVNKSIEDSREAIAISKLRPTGGVRRFVMIDEAQGILSNPQAAGALLKPMEEPPKTTTWIIGSMDPDKFSTTSNGKAMLTRATQFHLKAPTVESLTKQATRIIKGEEYTFFTKELRDEIVRQSNNEMRTLANLIEGVAAYYNGLDKRPAKLEGSEMIEAALSAAASNDDATAVKLLIAVYARKFGAAQRTILDIDDGFGFVKKLGWLNWFLLNDAVLKGSRHPKVWGTKSALALKTNVEAQLENVDLPARLRAYGYVQNAISKLQSQVQAFALPEQMAVSSFSFETIEGLKAIIKV